ncbi:gamma-glutamylcyclotransferase [bacterium]|nr:gamma-glutamylcyclotransferase [bacterium]MDB4506169.1 gamma-glutamylcyclotransferase [bacterium]
MNFANLETKADMISAIFVYGTLKRGQCRGAMWPVQPVSVFPVFTHGTLFDRHDYPAMTSGTDCVAGERWDFHSDQMPRVLEVLDAIEGANQPGFPDLYRRVVVTTWELSENRGRSGDSVRCSDAGNSTIAYTYHYAREPSDDGFTRVLVDQDAEDPASQCVCWPTSSNR